MLRILFGISLVALNLGISISAFAAEKELDCFMEVHKIDPVTGSLKGSVCDVKFRLADVGEKELELYIELSLPQECTEKLTGSFLIWQSNDPIKPTYSYMLYLNKNDHDNTLVFDDHGSYPGAIPNPFVGKYTYARDPKSTKKDRQIELKCTR